MATISVVDEDVSLDAPTLIEGFPGVGLVGKIATDHLIDTYGMTHYANVYGERIPPVAVYHESDTSLSTPIRLYADTERDLLALRSDVPVTPTAADELAGCLEEWFDDHGAFPVYLAGLGRERNEEPPEL